ncbi:MAG: signal peptidase I [Oscillospiraceae bacterium]
MSGRHNRRTVSRPTLQQLEAELKRERYRQGYVKTLRSTVSVLIVVAAIAVLVATLMLPVLRIYGSSMNPTLMDGDIVVSVKNADFQHGDVVAFYYNNKILVKRVIALPGEWVDIDEDGVVSVNGEVIDEPYLTEQALGECDIQLPYQVPDGRIFVMGDHRSVSVDSRSTTVGCIAEEQIVGRLTFILWPMSAFGQIL